MRRWWLQDDQDVVVLYFQIYVSMHQDISYMFFYSRTYTNFLCQVTSNRTEVEHHLQE